MLFSAQKAPPASSNMYPYLPGNFVLLNSLHPASLQDFLSCSISYTSPTPKDIFSLIVPGTILYY
ncbi:hypothetical protein CW304_24515 [Bacillus sp. UFRGS-B20]|nr:hypothetical protein CW304_24515 [Bacillus sp. UFRGS-B20]